MFDETQQPAQGTQESWDYSPPEHAQDGTADQQLQSMDAQGQPQQGTDASQQLAQQQAEAVIPEHQYKSLQSAFTTTRQELAELSRRNTELTDFILKQQGTQAQQQQAQVQPTSIWDRSEEEIATELKGNFKGTLRSMISAEAESLADKKLAPLREELAATQAIINSQKVDSTLAALGSKYGQSPVFQECMSKATDYILGEGREAARRDPAGSLERQFRFHFYEAAEKNPALLASIAQSNQAQAQQQDMTKRMAAPMTTRSNVAQPAHQPLMPPQPNQQNQALARQIAQHGNEDFWNAGQKPFNTVISDY